MDICKIAGIIILTVLLGVWLGDFKQEWKVILTVACAVFVALYLIGYFQKLFYLLEQKNSLISGTSGYMEVILKALGMTYICQFAADLCKDTGNHLLQSQIELCGKAAVLLLGLPILMAVVDTIFG